MENKTVKLSEFLKEHGAYEEFVVNFDKGYARRNRFEENVNGICVAFIWEESEQGHTYWSDLNNTWKVIPDKENDLEWLMLGSDEGSEPSTDQAPHMNHNIKAYPESFEIVQNHDDLLATVKWNEFQRFDVVLHGNSFVESEWDALTKQVADVMERCG